MWLQRLAKRLQFCSGRFIILFYFECIKHNLKIITMENKTINEIAQLIFDRRSILRYNMQKNPGYDGFNREYFVLGEMEKVISEEYNITYKTT